MALEPSSASTAPVTLPTRVPRGECSGTDSNWYWGLPFCRGWGKGITGGLGKARAPSSCQRAQGRAAVGAEEVSRPHFVGRAEWL